MRTKARAKRTARAETSAVERQPSALALKLETFGRSPLAYVVVSALLLLPCFWRSRIHACDLSSHIYNTWLAQLLQAGKITGVAIVPKYTNVLFDWMLAAIFGPLGSNAAQRIAVSVCVLVFAWGAFYCVARLAGRTSWAVMPILAILAYGWTFHMGFFNMYLSLGICLWAIGAAWDGSKRGLAIAAVLLALAFVAHGLPVAWTVALGVYAWAARRAPNHWLPALLGVTAVSIAVAGNLIDRFMTSNWYPRQLLSATGAFQAWIYGDQYLWVAVALMALWAALLYSLWRKEGRGALLRDVPFHFAVLTAVGIAALPSAIDLPAYHHGLTFIAERMSLPLAVCLCAVAARSELRRFAAYSSVAAAVVYFAMLYMDTGVLNALEDRMAAAVAQVPGQRVITGVAADGTNIDPIAHMVDRACLGVCYSYANYEPATWQFRLRAVAPNPFVVSQYGASFEFQSGNHIVQPSDLPMYRVDVNADGAAVLIPLQAGQPNGLAPWDALK